MLKKNLVLIGIGSAIAKELLTMLQEDSYSIYATSRTDLRDSLPESASFLQMDPIQPDLSSWEQFLPDSIHGLVYFPGSIHLKPFTSLKSNQFLQDLSINFTSLIPLLQRAIPWMKKGAPSSVVLFSSVAVQKGFPYHASISAAKGAIEGLCRSLAAEYASVPIRFNCIAPSLTNTPLAGRLVHSPEIIEQNAKRHPIERIGTPKDMASSVKFLLSDESSWITGQVLHVDGGLSTLNK